MNGGGRHLKWLKVERTSPTWSREAPTPLRSRLPTIWADIRNPEIGVFKINWVRLRELAKQTDVDGREIDELFRKTELDGFVREVDDKDKIVIREDPRLADVRRFRLHHRFAPVFGFSFRGPYGEFSLSESAFIEVVLAQKDFSLKEWVSRIAGDRAGKNVLIGQLALPGLEVEDE